MDKMKCDRCDKLVDSDTTSSCSVGHVDLAFVLPHLTKAKTNKLCMFDDQFFCTDCISNNVCKDCQKHLSQEDIETINNAIK
jgi:hypothetical protein